MKVEEYNISYNAVRNTIINDIITAMKIIDSKIENEKDKWQELKRILENQSENKTVAKK